MHQNREQGSVYKLIGSAKEIMTNLIIFCYIYIYILLLLLLLQSVLYIMYLLRTLQHVC